MSQVSHFVENKAFSSQHKAVLTNEILHFLITSDKQTKFLDCTFGGGGHTHALLTAHANVNLIALDQDPEAGERAQAFKNKFETRFTFHPLNFSKLGGLTEGPFDGILFDLGISSYQLDTAERGFSFQRKGILDMRMDPTNGMSAAEFLETASEASLIQAIRDYAEELKWRKVVASILEARGTGKLQTTDSFAALLESVVGKFQRGRSPIHPATRSFQGIRIAVNRELDVLEQALPLAFERLVSGGRLAVISFHSLEDRIVKRFFKRLSGLPEHRFDASPQQFRIPLAKILTSKPIVASDAEMELNPRSRSAKLRILTKL
jgi:16S rRNA (cytosine1402-N4)-methyltransferase